MRASLGQIVRATNTRVAPAFCVVPRSRSGRRAKKANVESST
jgi:hypothetical protein